MIAAVQASISDAGLEGLNAVIASEELVSNQGMRQELAIMAKLGSRVLMVLLATAAVSLLIFGHKPTTYHLPNGQAVRGRTVVALWVGWSGFEAAAMRDVVNKFNLSQSRIFVHMVSVSQVDIKTVISVAGGDPPDIVELGTYDVGSFIGHNALTSLEPMVHAGIITPHTFVPCVWKACAPSGTLYAVAVAANPFALYWNKTLFRQAGLNPNHAPATLAEFDTDAQRLTIFDKNGRLKQAGFLPPQQCLWGIYFGNHIYSYHTGHFYIDTPRQVAAYRWFQGFSRRLGYRAVTTFKSGFGQFNSPLNPFLTGKVAMEFSGPYFANFIQHNKPSMAGHFGVAPFPCVNGLSGTQTMGDVDLLLIPRHARHTQAAMKVLAFFIRQENIEKLDDLHCKASPLATFSVSFIRHNPNPYIMVFENLMLHSRVEFSPPSPIWMRVNSQLNVMAQRIWLGAPVKKSLAYTQHLVNRWVRTSQRIAAQRARENP